MKAIKIIYFRFRQGVYSIPVYSISRLNIIGQVKYDKSSEVFLFVKITHVQAIHRQVNIQGLEDQIDFIHSVVIDALHAQMIQSRCQRMDFLLT